VYLYVTPAIAPCEPDSSTLNIHVDVAPDAGVDDVLTLCADAPNIALFPLLGGTPDAGGAWLDPNGNSFSGVVDPSTELSGDYIYVAQGAGECDHLTDSATIVTALNHMPEPAFSALPLGGCHPLQVEFTNSTPVAQIGTCDWDLGDGSSSSNTAATFGHNYANPGLYDVTLTVTSPEGCVTTISHNNYIQVTPAPLATFDPFPNPTSVEEPTVIFSATDPHAISWNWTIQGLDSSHTEQEFSFDFPNVLGDTYEVCLHVTDQWGCEDDQCQTIVVKDPLLLFVPNSFTPNGDGVNDWFMPSLVGDDPNAFKMYIYDRWGEKVYESSDRDNAWIGTMMNASGDLLPTGVYAWRLLTKLDGGGKKEFMGHVTLLH
jgi:gliding motility-associated-like protein